MMRRPGPPDYRTPSVGVNLLRGLTSPSRDVYHRTAFAKVATMELPALAVGRRSLLKTLGSVTAGMALSKFSFAAAPAAPAAKTLRGLFPIASTPFTQDDKLDFDCLNAEVSFCNRAGVPGLI